MYSSNPSPKFSYLNCNLSFKYLREKICFARTNSENVWVGSEEGYCFLEIQKEFERPSHSLNIAVMKGDNSWVAVLVSLITAVQTGVRGVAEDAVPALTTDCLDDAVQLFHSSVPQFPLLQNGGWDSVLPCKTALSCAHALL